MLLRHRLLRQLKAALRVGHAFITGPPGYGKTTLLRALITDRPNTHYLALTPADADIAHLEGRLTYALEQNKTLLLDDVQHLVEAPDVVHWLVQRVERQACHLVLSGRALPPAVAGLMSEPALSLTATELAFTLSESLSLFDTPDRDTETAIAAWHRRAAGWPLAMILLARQAPVPGPNLVLPTAEANLFAYLAQILIEGLPVALQRFLAISAVPLRFNDELVAALQGDDAPVDQLRAEVQRRNLFLEETDQTGWFRYHDLVRDFLHQRYPDAVQTNAPKVVAWFEDHADMPMAIEHALDAGLESQAVRLIAQLPVIQVYNEGRLRSYQRWILSLSAEARAANPGLLIGLGRVIHRSGRWHEAITYLEQALQLAVASGDRSTEQQAQLFIASGYQGEGKYEDALAKCRSLLDDPGLSDALRVRVFKVLGDTLIGVARFPEAVQAYTRGLRLAEAIGDQTNPPFMRHNLATSLLIPLGAFQAARSLLEINDPHYVGRPGRRVTYLLGWAALYEGMGDWQALAATFDKIDEQVAQLPEQRGGEFWTGWYRALLATGRGAFEQAKFALDSIAPAAREHPERIVCLALSQVWLCRRMNRLTEAISFADHTLVQSLHSPLWRAMLALERDLAVEMMLPPPINPAGLITQLPALHPETSNLVRLRARAGLVRLRALLALRGWHAGDQQWRRHALAAVAALGHPGYADLLTHRDPELGARFWTLLLAEDVAARAAEVALLAIGDPTPLYPLLADARASVRGRAAHVLAALGADAAIPTLITALDAEHEPLAKSNIEAALSHLEHLPAPPLTIHVLGDFAVLRDGQPLPPSVWPRPIVRRLLQYFALHHRVPLSRERILDDLWPDSEPEHAWSTFRTVYSRLRNVLEPNVRPKAPSRYFAVDGDVYRFDRDCRVEIDAEQFERTIRAVLASADQHDIPPVPPELLAALTRWAPPLPGLPYEEWLLEPRARLETLYVEGCLYAAQALLAQNRLREATTWASSALAVAPWLEEGYQVLMRAHARLDQRGFALKAYADATTALGREFGAPPGDLTNWLAERIKRGEEI